MGVYREVDPVTGQVREFNIAGDTPTVSERVQINQAFRPDLAPSPILPIFDTPAATPAAATAAPVSSGADYLGGLSAFQQLLEQQRAGRAPVSQAQQYDTAATAIGRGIGLDPLQRRLSMLTSRRVIAEQMGDTEAAARLREEEDAAMAEIQAFIEANPMQDFYGIEGVGDFGSFAGEAIGQQASDIAIQAGATAAGAGVGALFGGVGAAPGAAIGRGLGVAYTTIRMLPQLFAENIRAQEEEGAEDVSLNKALATTVGQAMAEFVADYITLVPGSGEVASAAMRAVRQGGEGAIVQGGTEALQQAMTRFQAGQSLDDEEALKEIFEAFAAGAVIGAPLGAGVGAISAPTANDQLQQDAARALGTLEETAGFVAQAERPTVETTAGTLPETQLQLQDLGDSVEEAETAQADAGRAADRVKLSDLTPAERRSIAVARSRRGVTNRADTASLSEIQATLGTPVVDRIMAKRRPTEGVFAPIANQPFTTEQFNAVQDAARAEGKVNSRIVRETISKMTGQEVPVETQRAVINEFKRRNIVRKARKETEATGYEVSPQLLSSETAGSQARKEEFELQNDINDRNAELERLRQEERRLKQTGRLMDGRTPSKAKRSQELSKMSRRMNEIELENRAAQNRIQKINEQMGSVPEPTIPGAERPALGRSQLRVERAELANAPNREADAQASAAAFDAEISNMKKRLSAARKEQLQRMQQGAEASPVIDTQINALQDQISETQVQRELARSAALRGETPPKSTFSPVYTERFQKIADGLRSRLNTLGLKDVDLSIEGLIDGNIAVAGTFNAKQRGSQRVIRLASAIYDPNMSDADLQARLGEIMDHELIHALWNMGVFSDAELTSLRKAASERNFVEMIDGKPVKRKYTYLQRAQYFYPNRSPEIQAEEAIAEMFRNYAAGRDSMTGRPRSVFKRIVDVFKAIFRANKQENVASPKDIFDSVESGEIAGRDRIETGDDLARESRNIPADIKLQMRGPLREPRGGTYSGVVERYTVDNNSPDSPTVPLIMNKTTSGNADAQSQALDLLLEQHPDALTSVENWVGIANDAFGQTRVPMPPFRTIQIVQAGPDAISDEIGGMSDGMVRDANEGLAMAQRLGNAYSSGQVTPQTTARLFLWSFLSRGVSPYVQESAFLDAVAGPKSAGIDSIIERGIRDGWDDVLQAEYDAWASDAIPEGSPGKGTTHNLNAFGRNFLRVMLQKHEDAGNRTGLQIIHDMVSDGTPSYLIRREFLKRGEGAGIDNKVVSFTLLLMGRDDVLVLDRVQVRNQFDDGRFTGENIYDADMQDNKQVTGTAVADLTFGHKGLLYYETMERALKPLVEAGYAGMGREGSLGRYHWDSWVLASNQEVGHSSVEGLSREANGDQKGFTGTFVRQGKYNAYDYGFKYTVMPNGQMAVIVDTFNDGPYIVPRENLGSQGQIGRGMNRLKGLARRSGEEFGSSRPWTLGLNEAQQEQYDETIRSNGTRAPDAGSYATDAVGHEIDGSGVRYSVLAPETAIFEESGGRFSQRVASSFEQQIDRETSGTSPNVAAYRQMTRYTDFADLVAKGLGYFTKDKARAEARAYNFVRKFQDSFVEVGKMIKDLKAQGLEITDVIDPYLKDQLARSAAGQKAARREKTIYKRLLTSIGRLNVNDSMKESLTQASRRNAMTGTQGLAHHVFENSKSVREGFAEIYLYALHAKERNAYIRDVLGGGENGSGMRDAEADDILNWFSQNMRGDNRDTLTAIQLAAQAIVQDTNQVRADAGLIPRELAEGDPNFQYYVPLKGLFDDDDSDNYGAMPSTRRMGGREDKKLLGRADSAYGRDLVANLFAQNTSAIVRAERNGVNESLLRLFEESPELMAAYGEVLDSPQLERKNINGRIVLMPETNYRGDPDIVIVKRDGKEIPIRMFSSGISGAFNGMNMFDVGHAGALLRGLGKVNRYLSSINTSLNPEFVISNFARDVQAAGLNISEFELEGLRADVMKGIKPSFSALKNGVFKDQFDGEWGATYQEFLEAGGASAANPMANLDDQLQAIDAQMAEFRGEGKVMGKLRYLKELMENSNDVVENVIRLSTYKAMRDRGFSAERSAQAARSVTVDFTKTGDVGQFMNALFLFYNASLQGSFFLFRAAARSKKVQKMLAGTIGVGIMMDILNREVLSDEDENGISEYDKIPDYVLERNWVFMLPSGFSTEGNRYIAIPMPYGLHAFYNAGRSTSNYLFGGGYDFDKAGDSIARNAFDLVNPLGGAETFLNFVSPTVLDPLINLTANVDFTGRAIRKEAFPGQDASSASLYWNNTSPTAASIARILNEATGGTETISGWADVSPNDIEFVFDFLTGGAGRFAQRTIEAPAAIANANDIDEVIREIPLVRKLVGAVSSRENLGAYIEGRDRVNLARSEYRNAMRAGDTERASEARQRFAEEIRVSGRIRAIENARRQISERINAIQDNDRFPPERKQQLIDQLDERRQLLIAQGLRVLRDAGLI